jgi:hypothetical protein
MNNKGTASSSKLGKDEYAQNLNILAGKSELVSREA